MPDAPEYPHHFACGDLVRIKRGWHAGSEAIVRGADGSDHRPIYSLVTKSGGECAWFAHEDLELIDRHRFDLRDKWLSDRLNDTNATKETPDATP